MCVHSLGCQPCRYPGEGLDTLPLLSLSPALPPLSDAAVAVYSVRRNKLLQNPFSFSVAIVKKQRMRRRISSIARQSFTARRRVFSHRPWILDTPLRMTHDASDAVGSLHIPDLFSSRANLSTGKEARQQQQQMWGVFLTMCAARRGTCPSCIR